jgi:hypothetical protein
VTRPPTEAANGEEIMHPDLAISLDRADELLKALLAEYDRSLHDKKVGTRAVQLTHEVFERLRGVLDRVARLYWEQKVAPQLSEDDRDAAAVYFPIAPDQHSLDSILGGWRWKSVRDQHQPVYEFLRSLQPFISKSNEWLATLNDLTVEGKHLDLVPQKRTEQRVTTATGAPIDPALGVSSPHRTSPRRSKFGLVSKSKVMALTRRVLPGKLAAKSGTLRTRCRTRSACHKQPSSTIAR